MMLNRSTREESERIQMKKQVIGITGGIGCGKSAVMTLLKENYQAALLLTDEIAHDLMKPGEKNYKEIVKTFGSSVLQPDKQIDRKKLGAIVFSERKKLMLLNSITHPAVIEETKKRIDQCQKDPACKIICLESALLIDTDLEKMCDTIWYIFADQEARISRLIEGRGYTRQYCEEVIGKQSSEETYKKRADVILDNSHSIEQTAKQIKQYLKV